MKKEDLLARLRNAVKEQYPMPEKRIKGIQYPSPLEQFKQMSQTVGGQVVEASKTDDFDALIHRLYPEAKTIASNLPYIHCATENPDTIAEARDLDGTDVGVVEGQWGIAENGCIWIPQTMKEKAELFISEYLVVFLDSQRIVNNMHEAYERIEMDPHYNFGTFISGPSKTADIEQALVFGAQAARGLTVVLLH